MTICAECKRPSPECAGKGTICYQCTANNCYWSDCTRKAVFHIGRGSTPGTWVGACRRHAALVIEDRFISSEKLTVVRGLGFYS